MKFCTDHWEQLRAENDRLGMASLVATSGAQAYTQLAEQLAAGEPTKGTFDPLMAAHNAILVRCLERLGLDLFAQNEDGSEKCPLCEGQKQHLAACQDKQCTWDVAGAWIPSCCAAMREEAVRLGLLASA